MTCLRLLYHLSSHSSWHRSRRNYTKGTIIPLLDFLLSVTNMSISLLVAGIIGGLVLAAKVFRVFRLMYGKTPKIGDVIRILLPGNSDGRLQPLYPGLGAQERYDCRFPYRCSPTGSRYYRQWIQCRLRIVSHCLQITTPVICHELWETTWG